MFFLLVPYYTTNTPSPLHINGARGTATESSNLAALAHRTAQTARFYGFQMIQNQMNDEKQRRVY